MPSKTDFNVSPYFDDYTEDKKFHRVMYRPAFAVQARELTTQQSITQSQIERFGDHMFKHGAMVIPGQIVYDGVYSAVKLTSFNGTLSLYNKNTLTGGTSGVVADVIGFVVTDGTDPDTLFVKYRNSGTDNVSSKFTDGEIITSGQTAASTAVVSTCVVGSAVNIDSGTYYINGYFVNVDAQTLVLEKYSQSPSFRVGLTIVETFITSTDDTSILDNATGSSNANATGAHRFKIDLTLTKLSLTSTADASFVELMRVENGIIRNRVDTTKYSHLEDTLARRTFDESGDYTIENFDLDIREHLISGTNRGVFANGATSADGNLANEAKLAFGLGQGKAYVKGYEIAKIGTTYIDVNKARDFDTDGGSVTRFNIGSFVNVKDVFGTPDIGFVSGESEAFKSVRLVDEQHGTRGTVFGTALAHVFDIGRAKSRAFEHNSGSPTTNFLSSITVTDTTFKHYLFDIEMFTHINVKGKMSGALTTGDTLTGGTSGATGVIESVSTEGSGTITGATVADPVVITMSGGHNFTEGQNVVIASSAGMTEINGNHTVKNVTATTVELFVEPTATNSTPQALDGTSFGAWTSGGTLKHTTIVLNNIQGEFAVGETITAPTNSRTGVIQFNTFGCNGFEQKEFGQTKGVSMAGSPTFTANTSLDSTFGAVKTLSGTISTVSATESQGSVLMDGTDANGADSGDSIVLEDATEPSNIVFAIGLEAPADLSDRLVGSGTSFLTDFRLGDGIEFIDDGGSTTTRIIESISSDSILETSVGLGTATATSKTYNRLRAKLQDAEKNIAIARMPYDVVKTLLTTDNDSVSDTSFKIRRQFVATLSSSGTATITAGTNEVFSTFSENDYSVSIMTTGSGGTGAAGDVISLSTADDFTRGGSPTGKTLAINLGSGYNGHKIKILATISSSVVGAKTKTDTVDTQTVDTTALANATQINLGKADVHKLTSVFMAADFSTVATTSDTDVTDRFTLDTGQRDNFYDMGRLIRKSGSQAITGRLLVSFEFFAHGTGNFFSVDSYSGFDYGSIPAYTSDVTGEKFELRDVLDFRPRVDDASTIDSGDKDRTFDGTGASTVEVVKINTDVTADLEFFLAKKARIYLTSSGLFRVIEGASSLEPSFPEELKDSIHLYDISIPPYTFNVKDIAIKPVDNRRFTMRDIGRIQRRVENMEYYTQLSLLESDAKSMQIQDADGFDRFKNGIITDNFTGHGVGEVSSNDYKNSMDIPNGQLRPAFHQNNINLIESDSALANSTAMTDAIRTTNGYQKTGELITLPYTEVEYMDQPYASTTINLNEYNTIAFIGNLTLSPDNDEWMDTETQPELRVDIPDVYDTLTTLASEGVLDLNLGTVWNNWNDSWSGVRTDVGSQTSTSNTWWSGNTLLRNTRTSVDVQERVDRTRTGVRTALVPGGVQTTSFGNRVVSVGFASFIRSKDIAFSVTAMKPLTRIFPFFDGIDISTFVTPTGSSAGAALTTDANGSATGTFALPSPSVTSNPKWRTGSRAFRLTSSSTNSLTVNVFTSAEADYIAKGMIQQVQGTVVSSREPVIQRTSTTSSTSIQVGVGSRIVSNSTSAIATRSPPQGRDDSGNPDPLAQGFYIDQEDGMFVTSIDLFMSAKDSSLPVTMQVRPMVNGYPSSSVVLPFGTSVKQASEISISADATVATRFTFPSPVYVLHATEYCFVLICNTPEYQTFAAQMGQTTLDEGRLISTQPLLSSLFKSQNASTWTAEQNQTLKFKVNRAAFTENTSGKLHLVNDVIPAQLLKQNPIEVNATAGSGTTFGTNPAIIKINARNHGMRSTAHNVTIAGVPSGTVNGLASTNVNGTYTAIGNITLDSFTVTATNSDVATSTGSIGGSSVTITPNIQYDIIQPVVGLVQPAGSTVTAAIRTTGGRTLEQVETEFSLTTDAKSVDVEMNNDHYMNSPGAVYSAINETNEMSGSKSLSLKLTFSTPTGQGHVSPIIDTTRLSSHLIYNRINNPISGTTPEFVIETANTGGSTEAKYQTKPIILINESTALDIKITANVASTASVKMFYRLSNADDARNMSFLDWVPFNGDGASDKPVEPSENRYQFKEHQFTAKDRTTFTAFQLKITMTGTSSCYPPKIKDLRGIALAV